MNKNVKRIIIISLVINILLTIIKISNGIVGNSTSLFSDGINSLSDVALSILMLIIMNKALKEADNDHPYGHEKYEGFLNVILGVIILLTGLFVIVSGLDLLVKIIDNTSVIITPNINTLYAAIISVLIKVVLVSINYLGFKKYRLIVLKTDAKNHLGDIFATLASLIGIIFALNGYLLVEMIATIFIGIIIFISAIKVLIEAKSFLVDEAPSIDVINAIKAFINQIKGVKSIDDMKVRKHMMKLYVDIEIGVDYHLSLVNAHAIAEQVHHAVEDEFDDVIHCMVHVNPNYK